MLRRIIHQYKRMLFGGTLLTLTLYYALYAMDQFDAGMVERLQTPEGLIAIAVLSFGFIALCTALLAAFTPRFLDVIEVLLISLALTALIVSVLERIMPPLMALIGPNLPKPRDLTHWGEVAGWAEWSILFACFCLVCRFSIGPCPDWMRSNAGPYRGRFTSPEPPEEAWKLLYPLPGQLDRYFYPESTVSAAPEGISADFMLQRKGEAPHLVTVHDYMPGRQISMEMNFWDPDGKAAFPARGGTLSFTLSPDPGGGSKISWQETVRGAYPMLRLGLALSCIAREANDGYAARANGRPDRSLLATGTPQMPPR